MNEHNRKNPKLKAEKTANRTNEYNKWTTTDSVTGSVTLAPLTFLALALALAWWLTLCGLLGWLGSRVRWDGWLVICLLDWLIRFIGVREASVFSDRTENECWKNAKRPDRTRKQKQHRKTSKHIIQSRMFPPHTHTDTQARDRSLYKRRQASRNI